MSNSYTSSQPSEPLTAATPRAPSSPIHDAAAGSTVEDAVRRLRAELSATTDRARQSRLLTDVGDLEERAGDEAGAARDYLAAIAADPRFHEPLEGLVRLLDKRRSVKTLGRLVDDLAAAAAGPDEKVRALLVRARYQADIASEPAEALRTLQEATRVDGAPVAERAGAWLALEVIAGRTADTAIREEALGERVAFASDPTWRALLLLDRARLVAGGGDVDAAATLVQTALSLESEATWAATSLLEQLVRDEPGIPGSDEARLRAETQAEALEAQADLVKGAIADGPRGDALGVPRWMRETPHVVDAWSRAADARRRMGQLDRAGATLDRALSTLASLAATRGERAKAEAVEAAENIEAIEAIEPDEEPEARGSADLDGAASPLSPPAPPYPGTKAADGVAGARSEDDEAELAAAALALARIRIAEQTGDTALAAELAERRLTKEKNGGLAASLAMRVAEHAAAEGDAGRALAAISRAIASDPACLPARALQLDMLADGADPAAFATQLESFADHLATDEARGRTFLLAATVWAVRANDVAGAKGALSQAGMFGVPPPTVARVARMLACIAGDDAWYEEATRRLIASGANEGEALSLYVELVRLRRGRGDAEAASRAVREMGDAPMGAWTARALEAFSPPPSPPDAAGREASRAAVEELAALEPDADLARGLSLVAAMRAQAGQDVAVARSRLRELADREPSNATVAAYLGDLDRATGDHAAAARVAADAAVATSDPELAAAFRVEAAFERWREGDRRGAIEEIDAAAEQAPKAAAVMREWASWGVDTDSLEGRRHALECAAHGGGDAGVLALERFAVELAGGDHDGAVDALAAVEETRVEGETEAARAPVSIAAALARLAWSGAGSDPEGLRDAVARIASRGPRAHLLAMAERVRLARAADDAEELAKAAGAWWGAGGGLPAAIEWLAAAWVSNDPAEERSARLAVASALPADGREAMLASAALLQARTDPDAPTPLVVGETHAVRLANLELAPPGCDPRRRATALGDLDGALGDDAGVDALGLSGWAWLAASDVIAARQAFEKAAAARPADLAVWEGLRACAERTSDAALLARASAELGERCHDDQRGAAFWEEAAVLWLELGDGENGERALDASFARDPSRPIAFDKLFRRVRERKENDKLLALIARRLEVSEDQAEIQKLFWEQARVLREGGDQDGALKALGHVMMLDPDHVGALALLGEISIRRGSFEEAASALARVAVLPAAPPRNRVTAGVAAVDLYENKLNRGDKAFEVLLALHKAQLSTLPVRERLARAAARAGAWTEAIAILEQLMHERPTPEGRAEAARLAMAIHRDRVGRPQGGAAAIVKLLEESPVDGEAIDMLLQTLHPEDVVGRLLETARDRLVAMFEADPMDVSVVKRLVKVARALPDDALHHAALGILFALGAADSEVELAFASLTSGKPRAPQAPLAERAWSDLLAPGDDGPLAQLFVLLAEALVETLGPTAQGCGVTRRDRVDAKAGLPLRAEVAGWTSAFAVREFDLYVGGKDPLGVQGVADETPAIVVGTGVTSPLTALAKARLGRELAGVVRGTGVVRLHEDAALEAVVAAACRLSEVSGEVPYASNAEIERLLGKAISRKTRKLLGPVCSVILAQRPDLRAWKQRVLASLDRASLVACGDASVVLSDVLDVPPSVVHARIRADARAEELLRFAVSPAYLGLRRSLGLEGSQ